MLSSGRSNLTSLNCLTGMSLQPQRSRLNFREWVLKLQPLDIVLVNTAAGKALGNPKTSSIPGVAWATRRQCICLEQGVRVTGTDAWSWDAPFSHTAKKVKETGDTSLIWEGHKAGRDIGYCHLEKLHNLEVLPPSGFHRELLPAQDSRCISRLDSGRRNLRRVMVTL